jgi:glycosyltransferase involved in cell wall biosynthesis
MGSDILLVAKRQNVIQIRSRLTLSMMKESIPRTSETLVFVPSFNDVELLRDITEAVFSLPGCFIPLVIDDGSSTPITMADVASGTLLVRLPVNSGLGTATHIAFDHAVKYGYSIVARVDSDGQHPVASLPDIIRPLQSGDADMVVGRRLNRDDSKGTRARFAKTVRWYLTIVSKLVSGGRTPDDMNSGFFAVNVEAANKLNRLNLDRYPEPKIFLSANLLDIMVVECGINQSERVFGESSVNIIQAILLLYRFHMLLLARVLQKIPI